MPNYCNYDMKIKGSKNAIKRVIDCLKADYNYGEGKPSHKHFFRVFEVWEGDLEKNEDGTYTQFVCGYLAWSVSSCMLDGQWSYYESVKKDYPEIFMGTTLAEQSKDCTIEVFSEEEGMGFSEHYIFNKGVCECDDTCEIRQGGFTKNGKPTTRINWDTYEGDTFVINPHREGNGYNEYYGYAWEI